MEGLKIYKLEWYCSMGKERTGIFVLDKERAMQLFLEFSQRDSFIELELRIYLEMKEEPIEIIRK